MSYCTVGEMFITMWKFESHMTFFRSSASFALNKGEISVFCMEHGKEAQNHSTVADNGH